MSVELCSRCRTIREMKVTETKSTRQDSESKSKVIKIISYDCQVCNTFVRSEEVTEEKSKD